MDEETVKQLVEDALALHHYDLYSDDHAPPSTYPNWGPWGYEDFVGPSFLPDDDDDDEFDVQSYA